MTNSNPPPSRPYTSEGVMTNKLNEFELDLRRAVAISIADKGSPSGVEWVMDYVIKLEKRVVKLEHDKDR